jgi:tetratricopeptide (TPR) repeat protein
VAYNIISSAQLLERIERRCGSCLGNRPPLALVIGSGFSYPLIPTTSEMVCKDIPWWKWCQSGEVGGPLPKDFHDPDSLKARAAHAKEYASNFWQRVKDSADPQQGVQTREALAFDTEDGVPTNRTVSEAYKYVLSPKCQHGLNTPSEVRRYFADVVKRVGNRLNPAHLYLASLIAEMPTIFGTVFTTNIDPLLQRALQLVSAPYFVSDRPEAMEHLDDDDVIRALHVVHAHGSIYRYLLLNTHDQIEKYATSNALLLKEYFRKHTVLIVGYGGWDDAITRALRNVAEFEHNLYWCDRGSTPEASGLSNYAKDLLGSNSSAFYVSIESADRLMIDLYRQLVHHALPRVFREPISVMRAQLERCDLTNVMGARIEPDRVGREEGEYDDSEIGTQSPDEHDLGQEVKSIQRRLEVAEKRFKGQVDLDNLINDVAIIEARIRERMAIATDHYFSERYSEAIADLDIVLEHSSILEPSERALAQMRRGIAYSNRGQPDDLDRSITDLTAVIVMPESPAARRVQAEYIRSLILFRRGQAGDLDRAITDVTAVIDAQNVTHDRRAKAYINRGSFLRQRGQAGDYDRSIADFTTVIEVPHVPNDHRARAMFERAFTYKRRGQGGDVANAIADLTAVISIAGVAPELLAQAMFHRAALCDLRGQEGDDNRAIAGYTAVIVMNDSAAELRAEARTNRGVILMQRRLKDDIDHAIADFTDVINMPDVSAAHYAKALVNRGGAYRLRGRVGDADLAIADFTAAIDMPHVSAEQIAEAQLSRGFLYHQRGHDGDADWALADYAAVIEMPDVTIEQRVEGLLSRANLYRQRRQPGDVHREIVDYTTVIEMPDAPAERRGEALVCRGIAYSQRGQQGDVDREIADYTMVIDMTDVHADQRAQAHFNRAIATGQRGQEGDADRTIADYTAVIDMPRVPCEQLATCFYNRGCIYARRGQKGDIDRARSDFDVVIHMPNASTSVRELACKMRDKLTRPD